jgi:hypothetical protein
MNLSEHFQLEDFLASETASRLEIDNTPNDEQIIKLTYLASRLEDVRALFGLPLHINSGYRCLELNRALKSADTSQHVKCEAADIITVGRVLSPLDMCKMVRDSDLDFDQVIWEFNSWMHISFVQDRAPRRHVLTIDKRGTLQGLAEV